MSEKKPETTECVDSFLKKIEDDIDDRLPKPPEAETFRQKVVLWLFRCLLGLIGLSAVPAGTGAWSYGNKRAEINSELKKKRTEARLRQRDLQLKLLERIIEVAKGADFNDPTSLYRLGLIAHMVNENTNVFGLQLVEAEATMKKLFSRLAPMSGLRRRISESGLLIGSMTAQLKTIRTTIKTSTSTMDALRKSLQSPALPRWQRKKLMEEYDDSEKTLIMSQLKEEFYGQQLIREQNLLRYFQLELTHQSDVLKEMLQDAVALRDSLKTKSQAFRYLLATIRKNDIIGDPLYKETSATLDALDRDYQSAVGTIEHLTEDLNGEREQLKLVKDAYAQCQKQLGSTEVEPNTKDKPKTDDKKDPDDGLDVVFVPLPASKPDPKSAPAPKTPDQSGMKATPPSMALPTKSGATLKNRSTLHRVQRKPRPVLNGLFPD